MNATATVTWYTGTGYQATEIEDVCMQAVLFRYCLVAMRCGLLKENAALIAFAAKMDKKYESPNSRL